MPTGAAQKASTAARSASLPLSVADRWPAAESDQRERLLPLVRVSFVTSRYRCPRKPTPSCSTGSGVSHVGDLAVIDRAEYITIFVVYRGFKVERLH